jgi:hypothetical protein
MSCAIRIVHVEETRSTGFLVWPKNWWRRFVSGLASKPPRQFLGLSLKPKVDGLVIWASKPSGRRFIGLHLKIDERMKTV